MRSRILIIEDDAIQQKLYRLLSGRFGYEIVLCGTMKDAMDHLAKADQFPHLVLLDCILDGECGLDYVAMIKELSNSRGHKLPVVAVTANAFESDKQRCFAAGVDDYLSKPFTIDQFTSMIDRWSLNQAQCTVA